MCLLACIYFISGVLLRDRGNHHPRRGRELPAWVGCIRDGNSKFSHRPLFLGLNKNPDNTPSDEQCTSLLLPPIKGSLSDVLWWLIRGSCHPLARVKNVRHSRGHRTRRPWVGERRHARPDFIEERCVFLWGFGIRLDFKREGTE